MENKLSKFIIERHKKDGTEIAPVKVKKGYWVEPHKEKQDSYIYYPGTLVPHIHFMECKKHDKYNQLKGGPMPWTNPETIEINKELLATPNIYEKMLKAQKDNDTKTIEFLSKPLVTWVCPQTLGKKSIYAADVTVHNRNAKSEYVFDQIDRFEEGIKRLEGIYNKERVKTTRGIAALVNLLSAKFCFRVGNNTDKKTSGIGVTTFRPHNIKVDKRGIIHFVFRGKKKVKWHKVLRPHTDLENKMYDDLVALKNRDKEFLFTNGERVDSGVANELFREAMDVKEDERDFLSFHSWRHWNASKAITEQVAKLRLNRKLNKIMRSKRSGNKDLSKARLINKSINTLFKKVAKILNDTPGVVKSTYGGAQPIRKLYEDNGIKYDEKRRSFDKGIIK